MSIEPAQEQLQGLSASDDAGPVVMLNLLRFKARADGIDEADGITGAEAYQRYAAAATEFLASAGGRVLFAGAAQESVIGPQEGEWDLVLFVQYPSRRAFLTMIGDPAYLEAHRHRAAALADSRLIACRQVAI